MNDTKYSFFENERIDAVELIDLMVAVGWGSKLDYEPADVQRSSAAYPFTCHARALKGGLVGYVSAFSDGLFSTFIGEILVHPVAQNTGIGAELLMRVERRFAGVPIYATPFEDTREFFLKKGYRIPRRPMSVVVKRNAVSAWST